MLENEVSGKSGNRCYDSQGKICLPINQPKVLLWCIHGVRMFMEFSFLCSHPFCFFISEIQDVLKHTLPSRIYSCVFPVCPVCSLKSKKWSNLPEGIDHKACVVLTVSASFSRSLTPATKFFTTTFKDGKSFLHTNVWCYPALRKMVFSLVVWSPKFELI